MLQLIPLTANSEDIKRLGGYRHEITLDYAGYHHGGMMPLYSYAFHQSEGWLMDYRILFASGLDILFNSRGADFPTLPLGICIRSGSIYRDNISLELGVHTLIGDKLSTGDNVSAIDRDNYIDFPLTAGATFEAGNFILKLTYGYTIMGAENSRHTVGIGAGARF